MWKEKRGKKPWIWPAPLANWVRLLFELFHTLPPPPPPNLTDPTLLFLHTTATTPPWKQQSLIQTLPSRNVGCLLLPPTTHTPGKALPTLVCPCCTYIVFTPSEFRPLWLDTTMLVGIDTTCKARLHYETKLGHLESDVKLPVQKVYFTMVSGWVGFAPWMMSRLWSNCRLMFL